MQRIATTVLSALLCSAAAFAQSYTFVPIPSPGGAQVLQPKVNSSNTVVGSLGNAGSLVWRGGVSSLYSVPNAAITGINDSHVVVGYRQQGSYQFAYQHNLDTGAISNLHTSTNCNYTRSVEPNAIANTGRIVGVRVTTDCRLEAFQYKLGIHGLGFLDPTRNDRYSEALDVSDANDWICGHSVNSTGQIQAFVRGSAGMVGLPMGTFHGSHARGVNSSGVAVGDVAPLSGVPLPVRWPNSSSYQLLPMPAGMTSGYAKAINDSGVIVGQTGGRATAWAPQPHLIADLVNGTDLGWTALWADDVNASGFVVVEAQSTSGARQKFLAIPAGPTPTDCTVGTRCLTGINPVACQLLGGSSYQLCMPVEVE
ncbi:MAG: hypothetical protein ACOZQL_02945 [Myxococcota bacterium]